MATEPGGVRIGVFLPQYVGGDDIGQARRAEELGLDSVWLGDPFRAPDGLEAATLSTALLQATSRIEIGVNVFNMSIRSPQMLARTAATIEALYPGRFILGVGAGYPDFVPLQERWGFESLTKEQRDQRFRETVEYLDRYFRDEVVTYEGEQVRVDHARGAPAIGRRPAILVGSGRRSFMRLAARYAERWDGAALWALRPEHEADPHAFVARKLHEFAAICAEVGRDPAQVTVCQTVYAAVGATRDEAEALVEEAMRVFLMPNRPPVVGTPDDVAQFMLKSLGLGVREFQVVPVSKYIAARGTAPHYSLLESVAREVAPVLRAAAGAG